jgi:signal transduction histidine kinase
MQSALEVGDLEFPGHCAASYCCNALFAGVELRPLEQTTDGYAELMRRIRMDMGTRMMAPYRQAVKNLLASSGDPCRLAGDTFDEETMLPALTRAGHALVLATVHVVKAMLCYLFRGDEGALASAARAVELKDLMPAMPVQHAAIFLDALACLRVLPRRGPAEQAALLERVAGQQRLLKHLADAAPMNHLHRWHLVEAERLRVAGQPVAALDAYDRAVALAREHRYVHEEGLANELAAGFWLDLGKPHLARPYLVAARRCYAAWGAARKVRELDERYPALLEVDAEVPQGGTPVERLDLATVLKATDAISSELVLERLLANVVRIAMESAGARRGHLLLERDGRWSVAARGEVEGGVEVPPGGGAEPDEAILRVARLVARTRERLVLDDAAAAGPLAGEPPAAGRRTRALVCAPLLSQGRLVGLLHLDNDLVAGAFTPGRLTVLSLLAAQAAISIENAAHLERERSARQEAEFLAEAGALLARSLATEETLGELAKLTVKALCDWCVVDLAEGPLRRRLVGAHADPARQPILDELLRRHPPRRDAPEPIASVHRTGKPLLVREVRADEVRGLCDGDEEARLIEALGCRSIVAVPLVARGAPVAVLTLVAGTPGRFGPSHLQLAQELASRAAIALENARLFREAREAEALESQANERLRTEIAEREQAQRERARVEQQLLQAQKMESVGMLAGGVAHDFNNLLTVILSGAEALRDQLRAGAPAAPELVDEVADAGGRARDLTRQLLAFARRQVIAPVPLDLNALVTDCERLLRRVIGEDVELAVTLEPGLWPVRCDPAQLQQVILNLAVNARDAMPRGGRLAVATANVDVSPAEAAELPEMRPGPHVRLSLRDSGMGMTPEVQAHAFEPFYTTKPVGKGTGLGLATVYGIMSQSGGHVRLRSAPGEGTTFDLLFPRLTDVTATPAPPPAPIATTKGTETILVVEDDPHVRAVTTRSLAAAGYAVIEAANGDEALERAAGLPGRLHLVVTDVVLPGVDGRTLAERLRRARPELRVLYVSGHADEVVANRGILQPGIELLQKPFTASSLLMRVRSVLDSP